MKIIILESSSPLNCFLTKKENPSLSWVSFLKSPPSCVGFAWTRHWLIILWEKPQSFWTWRRFTNPDSNRPQLQHELLCCYYYITSHIFIYIVIYYIPIKWKIFNSSKSAVTGIFFMFSWKVSLCYILVYIADIGALTREWYVWQIHQSLLLDIFIFSAHTRRLEIHISNLSWVNALQASDLMSLFQWSSQKCLL
jgi:hypothetical protein